MYVLVCGGTDAPTVRLVEPDNFRHLHVQLDGVEDEAARVALRDTAFGELEADHAWLDTGALRRAGADSAEWRAGLDAMLGYAQQQGWTDDGVTRVRAHLVRI